MLNFDIGQLLANIITAFYHFILLVLGFHTTCC